jgi:hypothetical protein
MSAAARRNYDYDRNYRVRDDRDDSSSAYRNRDDSSRPSRYNSRYDDDRRDADYRRPRPNHSNDKCCFHWATGECSYGDSCFHPHPVESRVKVQYLEQLVCLEKAKYGRCDGCDKHHGANVIAAYLRLVREDDDDDDMGHDDHEDGEVSRVSAAPIAVPVVAAPAPAPIPAAAFTVHSTGAPAPIPAPAPAPAPVPTVARLPSIDDKERVMKSLMPTDEERVNFWEQLTGNPAWPGELYADTDEIAICTGAFLQELVSSVSAAINMPCHVSIVRKDERIGVMVRHPKIFVNNTLL